MEKQTAYKSKNKMFIRFIPKATAAISFQNPPLSPARNKRPAINNSHKNKFRTHLSSKGFSGPIASMIPSSKSSETSQEPTSPKVSCMGQIKHKKRMVRNKKQASLPKDFKPSSYEISKCGPQGPDPAEHGKAPSLSQMRRFASSHEKLGDLDWTTARIATEEEEVDDRGFCSDVVVVRVAGLRLEPRKEINLWKRRTMAQPSPLQLSIIRPSQ